MLVERDIFLLKNSILTTDVILAVKLFSFAAEVPRR